MADTMMGAIAAGTNGGVVQQTGLAGVAAGLGQGAQLALQTQQLQQEQDNHAAKMQQFKQQQSEWFASKMNDVSAITDSKLRVAQYKRLEGLARQGGIVTDPDNAILMQDDDHAREIQRGFSNAMGVPPEQRSSAFMNFMLSAGNSGDFLKQLNTTKELNNQIAQTKLNAQSSYNLKTMITPLEQATTMGGAQEKFTSENAKQADVLHNANAVMEAVRDPDQRSSPMTSEFATMARDLVANPGGVIRPGAIAEWKNANPGVWEGLKGNYRKINGNGILTDKQWADLAQLTQRAGDAAQTLVDQQKVAMQKTYGTVGGADAAERIASGMPKWRHGASNLDLRTVGGIGQYVPGGSTQTAQGQGAAGATLQSASNDPKSQFTSLPPAQQAIIQKRAAAQGYELDPTSANFGAQYNGYLRGLQRSTTQQSSMPDQGVSAPKGAE